MSPIVALAAVFLLVLPSTTTALHFITRAEWGAEPPRDPPTPMNTTPGYVIVHHTETPTCYSRSSCDARIRSIQHYHRDQRGWNDIGYQFLIVPSGDIYVGRGWGIVGAQAGSTFFNQHSIGVAFVGDYRNNTVPPRMWSVFQQLVALGTKEHKLTNPFVMKGHRDVRKTTCPGDKLYALVKADPRFRPGPLNLALRFQPKSGWMSNFLAAVYMARRRMEVWRSLSRLRGQLGSGKK